MKSSLLRFFLWNKLTKPFVLWLFHLLPICKNRILFISWYGNSYSCNPRYIAEAIMRDVACSEYDLNYVFVSPESFSNIPSSLRKIELFSLEYYYYLATTRFIVSNVVLSSWYIEEKKKGQIYIQAQHGGRGIKKIDYDDAEHLTLTYLEVLQEDVNRTDLMLSDSTFRTNVIRSAFKYRGEILDIGLPRNSIFFIEEKEKEIISTRIKDNLKIPHTAHSLIYTPTFRDDGNRKVYGFREADLIATLENKFGGEWYVLISSHPNMRDYYKEIYDFTNPRVVDVGQCDNLQELLLMADILVTDYSSVEFDFVLQKKPVFSLVKDANNYNRGLYIRPEDLPFPYAETDEQLYENINLFDIRKYCEELQRFESEVMGLKETGRSAQFVVEWIKKHSQ